jgi:CheY-like chemotaxis protein
MKRVLIVDDARELGRLLQTVFLTLDPTLTINVVPSAEEAIDGHADAARRLVACRLPGMSGFELVRKYAPPICAQSSMITGIPSPLIDGHVRELQVDGFFRKPLIWQSKRPAVRDICPTLLCRWAVCRPTLRSNPKDPNRPYPLDHLSQIRAPHVTLSRLWSACQRRRRVIYPGERGGLWPR